MITESEAIRFEAFQISESTWKLECVNCGYMNLRENEGYCKHCGEPIEGRSA